jgi:hypothetical protein
MKLGVDIILKLMVVFGYELNDKGEYLWNG